MHKMGNRRNTLLLHDGRRTQQRAGRHKEDIAVKPLTHHRKDIAAQYRRAASASRAARVNVLTLVKDHHTAVAVTLSEIDSLFRKQITQQTRSDLSQIAGKDHVVVADTASGRLQIAVDGVRSSR